MASLLLRHGACQQRGWIELPDLAQSCRELASVAAVDDLPRSENGEVVAEEVKFPIEIKLLRPVEVGGRKIGSLTLREPTALDIEQSYRHRIEGTRMVHMLSLIAELAPGEVRVLKSLDFSRAAKLVAVSL